jgi:UDP-glucuronate 4-epimerase
MVEAIGEVLGRTPGIERLPLQAGDVDRTWADLTRSRAELGYKPKVSFAEGLRRQWAWMQEVIAVG